MYVVQTVSIFLKFYCLVSDALFVVVFQLVLVTSEGERFWGQKCSRDTVLQSMECLAYEIP